MHGSLACVLFAILAATAEAQPRAAPSLELAPRTLSLATMDGFRPTTPNWHVGGGASAGRNRPLALTALPGAGVLVNIPMAGATGQLFTLWEHGDLDLSFDVMVPKGSSTGVYLMGRYELALSDSWGAHALAATDIGAIRERWDNAQGASRQEVDGVVPRLNASRAPGLWQHLDISFRAPRFAGQRKVANARFARVAVNGVVVHEDVEVSGPTRDAAFADERPTGPLMLPGDQGPLALRNVRYKAYSGTIVLTSLRYRAFEGEPMDSSYAATHAPVREGVATAFSPDPAGTPDRFALAYDGMMGVPTSGLYRFQLDLSWIGGDSATRGPSVGGGRLTIDGRPVLMHTGSDRRAYADVELKAGPHPVGLTYYKNRAGFQRRDIALWVEGPGVERQALHDEIASAGGGGSPVSPIVVAPEREPVVVRSFVRHGGTKRVIAASVADPVGVHYSYDLAQGSLLYVWRGPFLETTQMWHERGEDQTAEPLGSAVTMPGAPSLAFLADRTAAWPDSTDDRQFRRDGYSLDLSGHPTFLYRLRGVTVRDDVRPAADGLTLRRELHLRAPSAAGAVDGLYLQLAQGEAITRQADGSYVVGDRAFYITVPGTREQPVVRRQNGRAELLLPVRFTRGEASVAYNIVW